MAEDESPPADKALSANFGQARKNEVIQSESLVREQCVGSLVSSSCLGNMMNDRSASASPSFARHWKGQRRSSARLVTLAAGVSGKKRHK